jgi:hypothetical protein
MFGLSFVGFEFCAFAWDLPFDRLRPWAEAEGDLATASPSKGGPGI